MPKLINGEDLFEVQFASIVTDYDRIILLRLYQPICGYGPIGIYLTLASEMEAERTISTSTKTHTRLFEVMLITADKFLKFRLHLEALGLLKTYLLENEKGNKYIYRLKAPVMPDKFYEHPVLANLLKKYLSEEEYERTKLYFLSKIGVKPSYKEISVHFNEVYTRFEHDNSVLENNSQIKRRDEAEIIPNFDYEAFMLGLKEYQIPKSCLDKKTLKSIGEYATIYKIGALEMRDIAIQALEFNEKEKFINLERLAIFVRRYCEQNSKMKPANEQTKDKDIPIKATKLTGDSQIKNKLDLLNEIPPQEYLRLRNNNKSPLSSDLMLIVDLKNEMNLKDPVINVILDYCLEMNKNRLVPNYVKKVASSLMRSDIHDAYQAMKYLSNNRSSNHKKTIVEENESTPKNQQKQKEPIGAGVAEENKWW